MSGAQPPSELLQGAAPDVADPNNNAVSPGETPSQLPPPPGVREIHKNSWLKKMPCLERWPVKFPKSQRPEKFWVVFCVHDDRDPLLEFYENRRSAYSHSPLTSVSLSHCLHVSPTLVAAQGEHEFVVTLRDQVLRLAASTNEQMVEWMDTLSTRLRELGVLEPKDNLYSKEPNAPFPAATTPTESQVRDDLNRLSMRDPNSPLPPVPRSRGLPNSAEAGAVNSRTPSAEAAETAFSFDSSVVAADQSPGESSLVRAADPRRMSQEVALPPPDTPPNPLPVSASPEQQPCLYEPLFYNPGALSVGMSVRNPSYEHPPAPSQRHVICRPTPALPPRPPSFVTGEDRLPVADTVDERPAAVPEAQSSLSTDLPARREFQRPPSLVTSTESVSGSSLNGPASSSSPGRSRSETGSSSGAADRLSRGEEVVLSLREAQVQKLRAEMQHKSGVRLLCRKKDCLGAIAFVEAFSGVWIAGWKQKERPLLHNTFHVGDRLVSIGGLRITSAQDAALAVKQQPTTVEFVVRRVPLGKIFVIRREYEGQDLGVVREGGTAEIREVKPGGLAFRQGVPPRAPGMDGGAPCNWVLTEINHRPLNLFFKDNEVHDRLNAVGLDISLLVQPSELVKALKKQLKAIRGYKDFILQ